MRRQLLTRVGALLLTAALVPARAQPTPETTPHQRTAVWSADVQVLAGVDLLGVRESSGFNPRNLVASLPSRQSVIELRPDFNLEMGRFTFNFGPRLLARPEVNVPHMPPAAEQEFDNFYVNRWRAGVKLTPSLTAAWGREVLQGGNSVFRSPSNPFLTDNGRLNPIRELPGRDFATLTWTPSRAYALTFISNTGQGHDAVRGEPFRVTNALKLDYVGERFNATVIASRKQGGRFRLGGSYTYSASDAVLIYGEATAAQGSDALYPAAQEPASAPQTLLAAKDNSGKVLFTTLSGASYTFRNGFVSTVEYLYSNEGYSGSEARSFSSLQRSALQVMRQGGPAGGSGAELLGRALSTGLRVERQNYLFFQGVLAEYRNRADFAVSYARNLDAGGGGSFAAYATVSVNSRTQFYAVGTWNNGPAASEFQRLNRFTLSTGIRLFFSR
ncbi:MAG TPA: hypothetical protein VES20_01460 [Bryobacteraceae bacterium]|nr:hypothetical protein [Bryobacteraceae bacterium]